VQALPVKAAIFQNGIHPEDFDIIPTNQDLYACDELHHSIAKLSKSYFSSHVGDLLITSELSGKLFIMHWDAATTNFTAHGITYRHMDGSPHSPEHATFAPIDLPTQ